MKIVLHLQTLPAQTKSPDAAATLRKLMKLALKSLFSPLFRVYISALPYLYIYYPLFTFDNWVFGVPYHVARKALKLGS